MVPAPKKLLVVIGTRPEAIKLAPVILKAQADPRFAVSVVRTSQHQEMLDQIVEHFELPVAKDLDIMRPNQELAHVTAAALEGLDAAIRDLEPDWVVVQGDTSTTFAGALAAFYRQVPVAHVEAGLRTGKKHQPFPEEINRCLTSKLTDRHFAPTDGARDNLLREGIPAEQIWVTGNTAIDALFLTLHRSGADVTADPARPLILLTAHRRESHGEPTRNVCRAVLEVLRRFPQARLLYPVHKSPRVREVVFPLLSDHPRIELVEPLGYSDFVRAMGRCHLILTDSGGIQEEAPALGKPVLVLRAATERPEAVEAGAARLVGTDPQAIIAETERLLADPEHYRQMAQARSPFGDGRAAERILSVLAG